MPVRATVEVLAVYPQQLQTFMFESGVDWVFPIIETLDTNIARLLDVLNPPDIQSNTINIDKDEVRKETQAWINKNADALRALKAAYPFEFYFPAISRDFPGATQAIIEILKAFN